MKISTLIIILLLFAGLGYFILSNGNNASSNYPLNYDSAPQNVSIVDGVQIVEITAKGGYQPRRSIAKSGVPTIIRFDTNSTFDCSSSVRIPSMDISKSLPISGTTDINLENPNSGILQGTCGMGMYLFEIDFQ